MFFKWKEINSINVDKPGKILNITEKRKNRKNTFIFKFKTKRYHDFQLHILWYGCFYQLQCNNISLTDDWSIFQNYTYNHGHRQAHVTGVLLDPGRLYRFVVKLCAGETCYRPVHSNGVLILANPPTTGALDVQHDNTTTPEKVQT